jgi:hypothetical protein
MCHLSAKTFVTILQQDHSGEARNFMSVGFLWRLARGYLFCDLKTGTVYFSPFSAQLLNPDIWA